MARITKTIRNCDLATMRVAIVTLRELGPKNSRVVYGNEAAEANRQASRRRRARGLARANPQSTNHSIQPLDVDAENPACGGLVVLGAAKGFGDRAALDVD